MAGDAYNPPTTFAVTLPSRPKRTTSLTSLPSDIILAIATYLTTAQDVSALIRSSATVYQLTDHGQQAWRVFLRRFSEAFSVPINQAGPTDYAALVRRITWVETCWQRRSLKQAYWERHSSITKKTRSRGMREPRDVQRNLPVVVDAMMVGGEGRLKEMVVWGMGENVTVRMVDEDWTHESTSSLQDDRDAEEAYMRGVSGNNYGDDDDDDDDKWKKRRQDWIEIKGQPKNHISAIEAYERGGVAGALVGRWSGGLERIDLARSGTPLWKAWHGDGDDAVDFEPGHMSFTYDVVRRPSPAAAWRNLQTFVKWDPRSDLIAAADGNSTVRIYNFDNPAPCAVVDIRIEALPADPPIPTAKPAVLKCATFIQGGRALVCGFSSVTNPLHIADIDPSGTPTITPAAKNDVVFAVGHPNHGLSWPIVRDICALSTPSFSSPVTGSDAVVLSAWSDGTCRLFDVRTPSPVDTLYRDEFAFTSDYTHLLIRGARGFIAADDNGLLYLYDLRMSRPYSYTDAMPCSRNKPNLPSHYSRITTATPFPTSSFRRCDYSNGTRCTWHSFSDTPASRPTATLYPNWDAHRVRSLASASPLSTRVYVGIDSALSEITLGSGGHFGAQSTKASRVAGDASASRASGAARWKRTSVAVGLVETGTGETRPDAQPAQWMPMLFKQRPAETSDADSSTRRTAEMEAKRMLQEGDYGGDFVHSRKGVPERLGPDLYPLHTRW